MLQPSGSDPPTAPETPPEGGGRLTASPAFPLVRTSRYADQASAGPGSRTVATRPGQASSRVTVPPCAVTSSRTIASPRPAPPWSRPRAWSSRVNRSNTRSRSAAGIPGPSSVTVSSPGPTDTRTVVRACRTALSTRLMSTRRTAPGSARTTHSPSHGSSRTATRAAAYRPTTSVASATRSTGSRGRRGASSTRASSSRSSTSRDSRSTSSSTSPASSPAGVPASTAAATSSWVRALASGERSSCAASETNARCRAPAASSRASMSLSVSASRRISSWATGTGSRPDPPSEAAPRRSASTGRSARPVTSHIASPTVASSSGAPIARPTASTRAPDFAPPKSTATTTVCGSPAGPAGTPTTRSGPFSPIRVPLITNRPPARTCASSAGRSTGTSRSVPPAAARTRPRASTTWIAAVPSPPTGTGSGSRPASTSAATSPALCSAPESTAVCSARDPVTTSSAAPAAIPTPSSAVATTVSRARRVQDGIPPGQPAAGEDRSATVGGEPVAGPAHGLHRPPPERGVDLAAEVAHVDLDDVEVALVMRVPHVAQDVGLGHDLAGPAQQVFQQRELPRRQLDLGVAPGDLVLGRVEREVAGGQHGRARRGTPAQQRAQPRHQHHVRERLGQVVVSAHVQAVGLVVLAVLGREHEHRHPVAVGPQPLADPVAGQAGQHH